MTGAAKRTRRSGKHRSAVQTERKSNSRSNAAIFRLPIELFTFLLSDECTSIDTLAYHDDSPERKTHGALLKPIARVAVAVCRQWRDIIQGDSRFYFINIEFAFGFYDLTKDLITRSRGLIIASPKVDVDIHLESLFAPRATCLQLLKFLLTFCDRWRIFTSNGAWISREEAISNSITLEDCKMPRLLCFSLKLARGSPLDARLFSSEETWRLRDAVIEYVDVNVEESTFFDYCSSVNIKSETPLAAQIAKRLYQSVSLTSLVLESKSESLSSAVVCAPAIVGTLVTLTMTWFDLSAHYELLSCEFLQLQVFTLIGSDIRPSMNQCQVITAIKPQFPCLKRLEISRFWLQSVMDILSHWGMPTLNSFVLRTAWNYEQFHQHEPCQKLSSLLSCETYDVDTRFNFWLFQRTDILKAAILSNTNGGYKPSTPVNFAIPPLRELREIRFIGLYSVEVALILAEDIYPSLEKITIEKTLRDLDTYRGPSARLSNVQEISTQDASTHIVSFLAGFCDFPKLSHMSCRYPPLFGMRSPFQIEPLFELASIKSLVLVDWYPNFGSCLLQNLRVPNLRELHLSGLTARLMDGTFGDKFDPQDWKDFCLANVSKLTQITHLSLFVPPGVYTFTRRFRGDFSFECFANLTHLSLNLIKAKGDFLINAFQLTEKENAMPKLISLLLYVEESPEYYGRKEFSLEQTWIPAIGHFLQERKKRGMQIQKLWVYTPQPLSSKAEQRLQKCCSTTQLSFLRGSETKIQGWDAVELHKLIGM